MLNLFIFLILLVFIEVKIASFIYGILSAGFGANMAFILSWGYFFLTLYLANKILKGSGITRFSGFKEHFNHSPNGNNSLFTTSKHLASAILLFIPGYLTDILGFLIFFSDKFAAKLFHFVSQKIFRNLFKGHVKTNIFYQNHYSDKNAHSTRKRKEENSNIVDVEYTEVDDKKLEK